MTEEIVKNITDLKVSPKSGKVDHISIMHELYRDYSSGTCELKPIMEFFLNGFDDLPTLKEKKYWNTEKYNQLMKPFFDSHSDLIEIIDKTLSQYGK